MSTAIQPPDWFLEFMAKIVELYPQWPIKDGTPGAYWLSMHDIAPEDLMRALVEHAAHSQFAPSIAELRTLARPIGELGLTAPEAWDEMRRNRRKYSPCERNQNHLITWSSEAVRRAADAVGWTDLNWPEAQIPTIRAQFERYFAAMRGKQDRIDNRNEAEQIVIGMRGLIGKRGTAELYGRDYRDPPPEETRRAFEERMDDADPNWREGLDHGPTGDDP
jgi:hypothetical protein